MENRFLEISPKELKDNPFQLIGTDWMLITAGDIQSYNTMTASWGGLGVLWNKNVAFCFIRPVRYTYGFMENADHFTLSFFDDSYRKALNFCGTHSGRDCNKAEQAGLTAMAGENRTVLFQEARLVLLCRKLYYQDIQPDTFIDPTLDAKNYPKKDYHRMYVGEILKCLKR